MGLRIAFTGGGTGGHVFPALSVYENLVKVSSDIRCVWIGSAKGLEYSIVRESGIPFKPVPSGKLRRYFSFRNFFDLFRIFAGFVSSLVFFLFHRPDVLFSKGGFVSVPPVWAAGLLRIPVISHESDLDPGLATRLNARFSRKICLAYPESVSCFSPRNAKKTVVTGNPVRDAVNHTDPEKALAALGLAEEESKRAVIMVTGGSQGARALNIFVNTHSESLAAKYTLIHQTGDANAGLYVRRHGYYPQGFFKENHLDLVAASRIVISRAGAGTLWECATLGVPMILVPLSTGSSRGDQLRNARYFEKHGAACVVEEKDLDGILSVLISLMEDEERRNAMVKAARMIVRGNASEEIAHMLIETAMEVRP